MTTFHVDQLTLHRHGDHIPMRPKKSDERKEISHLDGIELINTPAKRELAHSSLVNALAQAHRQKTFLESGGLPIRSISICRMSAGF